MVVACCSLQQTCSDGGPVPGRQKEVGMLGLHEEGSKCSGQSHIFYQRDLNLTGPQGTEMTTDYYGT